MTRSRSVLVAASVASVLVGCGNDSTVSLEEARSEIAGIAGARVAFSGAADVVQGRAFRGGDHVDFRVVRRGGVDPSASYTFASGAMDSGVGCAGVLVYIDRGARSEQAQRLASAIELAVFHGGAPDAYCEG